MSLVQPSSNTSNFNQMHMCLSPPELGKEWCARGTSVVLMIAYAERGDLFGWDSGDCINVNIEVGHRSICEISNGNVWAKLSGRARHLQQAWRQADRSPFANRMLRSNWRMYRSIALLPIHPHDYARSWDTFRAPGTRTSCPKHGWLRTGGTPTRGLDYRTTWCWKSPCLLAEPKPDGRGILLHWIAIA